MTCRDLLKLPSFQNVKLLAGESGLDHVISWPYPKHTKVISPWVRGGEFVMVSGYEMGVNTEELLSLLDEAVVNQLSGILVEGGINFKTLDQRVLKRADEISMPLFFAARVVSFLDISREISSSILESSFTEKYNSSLLKQLLSYGSLTPENTRVIFNTSGVPYNANYLVVHFTVFCPKSQQPQKSFSDQMKSGCQRIVKSLLEASREALLKFGMKTVYWQTLDSLSLLLYSEWSGAFDNVVEELKNVMTHLSGEAMEENQQITLSQSNPISEVSGIVEGFNQAYFTATLLRRGLFEGPVLSFEDTGSYQFIFYTENKEFLFRFRDRCLKALHDYDREKNAQLLDTLRAYLNSDGNMLQTAESLYIHRNTLQHRLNRITSITGMDVSKPDVRRDFLNALMILGIYPYPDEEA